MKIKGLSWLINLFYPRTCICCETHLLDQEELICLTCRFDLPMVDNLDYRSNSITKIFQGRIPIEKGASFLFYHESGKTKKIIHHLKYKGRQEIGSIIGYWFGKSLVESNEFKDINYIIPVPLHRSKLRRRGYNQLTTFGKELSELLSIPFNENILQRKTFTKTQTRKKRLDRFQNTEARFIIEDRKKLNGKNILLIDDVITTGATLESCCKELLKSNDIKISILTIGITE